MSIIVGGTVRIPPQNMAAMQPHMAAMLAATRKEDGCIVYSFAEDVLEPGLLRIFEVWRDGEALTAHTKTEHMKVWRAAGAEFGVSDRNISLYEGATERAL